MMASGADPSGTCKVAALAEAILNLDAQTTPLESQFLPALGDFDADVSVRPLAPLVVVRDFLCPRERTSLSFAQAVCYGNCETLRNRSCIFRRKFSA